MASKLKILANLQRYDYGDPARGSSFEYDTFFLGFKKMGHQVSLFDYGTAYRQGGQTGVHVGLMKVLEKRQFDLIFTFPSEHQFSAQCLDALKKKNSRATSLAWMADDKWRWSQYSQFQAPHFDYVVTTDPDAKMKYQSIGYQQAVVSQWAHDPTVFKRKRLVQKYPVVFVGGISPWRSYVISYLSKQGIDVTCFGQGWPHGRVTTQEMVSIYNQAKIVINLSNSTQWYWPYVTQIHTPQLHRGWKDAVTTIMPGLYDTLFSRKRQEDIKARFFEVTGCGAFLLTYNVPHLADYFTIGEDLVCYDSLSDLAERIRYYLAHEGERQDCADHGYLAAHRRHTYQRRFAELFKQIGLR